MVVEIQDDYSTHLERELLQIQNHLLPNIQLKNVSYHGYDHITWYLTNGKQAAHYFITCLGFRPLAYSGLETGSRAKCSYVVSNGAVVFQFTSPLRCEFKNNKENNLIVKEINDFVTSHGDGVKDVAFEVDDVKNVFMASVENGAKIIERPKTIKDQFGEIEIAKVGIFGDTIHTLINRKLYSRFLPGYFDIRDSKNQHLSFFKTYTNSIYLSLPEIKLIKIDHCVQNQGWNKMEESCEFYAKAFGFHRFWSVDERDVSTEYSALKSIVMAAGDLDTVKMPINEPAKGKCKSQIEEFLDYYNGPGVQHIAILTNDIISVIKNMKERACQFINVPGKYYEDLQNRLSKSSVKIQESLDEIKELGILVDFDDNGYLLQLFSQPIPDRPTVFIEIIQRNNHNGFGAGNFKALFETIEQEQQARGNLVDGDSMLE